MTNLDRPTRIRILALLTCALFLGTAMLATILLIMARAGDGLVLTTLVTTAIPITAAMLILRQPAAE